VVEARVDQPQADHRQPEQHFQFLPDAGVRAEAVPSQDHPARGDDVALTLVDPARFVHRAVALTAEPVQVGRAFGGPLGIPEPGAEHGAADYGGPVGREHHVRQVRVAVDELDRVTEAGVGVPEPLPLADGQRRVDRVPAGHPRVDGVPHGEVLRAAHQVAPRHRRAGGRLVGQAGAGRRAGHGARVDSARVDSARVDSGRVGSGHRTPLGTGLVIS
jgi:hypothetical protein